MEKMCKLITLEWVVGWLEGVPPLGVVGWMEWDRHADGWLIFFFLIPKYFIEVKALLKPGGVFIPRPTSWRITRH